jgi:O-antigen/teichoic acid export membrane protein
MSSKKSFRNFSFVLTNRIITTGIQGLFWLIIAALLPPEEYGELGYFIAIAGIFSLFARFGFPQSIVVFQSEKNINVSQGINFLAVITSAISALILLPFHQTAAIACLGFTFFAMNQHNLLGLRDYKNFMWNGILKSGLLLTIPILLYFVLEIPGIILGMAIADLLSSIKYMKLFSINLNSFSILKKEYKILIHNFATDLSSNLPRTVDKILIVPLFGFYTTGLYQFNLQILFALEVLPVAIQSFILSEESSGIIHKRLIYFVILGSIAITIFSIIIAPFIIPEFFPNYSEGIPALQILLLSLIPLSITAILQSKLQSKKSTKIGYSVIVRVVSLLILLIVLGQEYGLLGLSYAYLLSIIANVFFLLILFFKLKT